MSLIKKKKRTYFLLSFKLMKAEAECIMYINKYWACMHEASTNLRGSVDIRDVAVLRLVDERGTSDVVPHLAACHGEHEDERSYAPRSLVVQKLEIISAEVEESSDEAEEHEQRDGASVVWWSEHPNVHLCPLADPFGYGLRPEAHPLYIHGVQLLGLSFGWKVHEDGSRVKLHELKYVRALVKVHHGEEHLVRIELRVAIRVGHKLVLGGGLFADCALSLGRQCCEHDYDGVVSWCIPDKVLKLVAVQFDDGSLGREVHQLRYLLGKCVAAAILLGRVHVGGTEEDDGRGNQEAKTSVGLLLHGDWRRGRSYEYH